MASDQSQTTSPAHQPGHEATCQCYFCKMALTPVVRDGPYSTRDPRRSGIKAAILARLRDRRKSELEAFEPGISRWRVHGHRSDLLSEIIAEIEDMQDVE